jgi:hypothetical protein
MIFTFSLKAITKTTPSSNITKMIIIVIIYLKRKISNKKVKMISTYNEQQSFSNHAPIHPTAPSTIASFAK